MKDEIVIKDEFIKLGQAMKLSGMVESGIMAKMVIQSGNMLVNGEKDDRRGRKLYNGDTFTFEGKTVTVKSTYVH